MLTGGERRRDFARSLWISLNASASTASEIGFVTSGRSRRMTGKTTMKSIVEQLSISPTTLVKCSTGVLTIGSRTWRVRIWWAVAPIQGAACLSSTPRPTSHRNCYSRIWGLIRCRELNPIARLTRRVDQTRFAVKSPRGLSHLREHYQRQASATLLMVEHFAN